MTDEPEVSVFRCGKHGTEMTTEPFVARRTLRWVRFDRLVCMRCEREKFLGGAA